MKRLSCFRYGVLLLAMFMFFAGGFAFAGGKGEASDAPKASGAGYKAGAYTAVGEGRNGPVVVKVTFSDKAITDIKVISHNETYRVGDVPIQAYPAQIVKNQSLAVDMVSGATISSVAMLNAVYQCVKEAGGDPAKLRTPIPYEGIPAVDAAADVVVIGSGAAGLTAAANAAAAGKKVVLVEKLGLLGGTSLYSIESFGASQSNLHKSLAIPATADEMYANYLKANPKGVASGFDILAHNNGAAADWLWSIGAPLAVTNSPFSVTASREAGKMGQIIVPALIAEAKKKGVEFRLRTKALSLVTEGGAVVGVKVKNPAGEYTIKAKAVVIAAGGYAANNEMVSKSWPALKGYKFSSSPGATGDGIVMAEAVGAKLRDMDYIRVNFTYHTDGTRVFYTGSLANSGAIFVNNDGKRIMNDQAGYGVGKVVVDQGGTGWMIFDRSIIDSFQDVREFYNQGLYQSAPTIKELAEKIGVNKDNLAATIERYVGFVNAGQDKDFGRRMLNMRFDEPPYYACKMTCHVQGTFGGIVTDTDARVLNQSGAAIPGLFAAGECASVGTYGANPMAANIVFGTIAGRSAAAFVK